MTIDPTIRRLASTRRSFVIGTLAYTRADLERACDRGQQLEISVVGLLSLSDDITPELARAAIASVRVRGVFRASAALKDALADRTR